ncbi:MAG: hypothetical protein QNJ36_10495 [Calothrix sp. MO_167.B42]|nr:hypothetical protein [Calothrix sp. MO_167.B42]
MNLDECSEKINHKNISLQERKSKIILSNKDLIEVTKIKVDNCLDIQGVKCDWLVVIDNPQGYPDTYIEIYIELKGSDVKHGFEQIENTIKDISSDPQKIVKFCYVIFANKCPLSSTEIQNKKKYFKKNYNATLKVERTGLSENINDLITGR